MPKRPSISLPLKTAPEPIAETPSSPIPPEHAHWKQYTHIKATFYVPRRVHEELRKLAFMRNRSQQEIFTEALDRWLEHECGKTIREIAGE